MRPLSTRTAPSPRFPPHAVGSELWRGQGPGPRGHFVAPTSAPLTFTVYLPNACPRYRRGPRPLSLSHLCSHHLYLGERAVCTSPLRSNPPPVPRSRRTLESGVDAPASVFVCYVYGNDTPQMWRLKTVDLYSRTRLRPGVRRPGLHTVFCPVPVSCLSLLQGRWSLDFGPPR